MNASPRLTAALTLAVLLAGTARRADALATESFGKAPLSAMFPTFTASLMPVLNDPSRVYWYEVNGDASFYYQGDVAALNALLNRFAADGKSRELVIHAGPLEKTDLVGKRRVDANWYVHLPGGLGRAIHKEIGLVMDDCPTLHLYVSRPRPPRVKAAEVARWVKGLDSDDAEARRRAFDALQKLGEKAAPALREALKTGSAEVRARARALLDRLTTIHLDALTIPAGLTVVGPDGMMARFEKGMKNEDYVVRGIAATRLSELEPDRKKAVAWLMGVLQKDKHEYVQRSVIGSLGRAGKHAEPAVPALRGLMDDKDRNVANAAKSAVEMIEKAKADPAAAERARLVTAVREDIRAFLAERAGR